MKKSAAGRKQPDTLYIILTDGLFLIDTPDEYAREISSVFRMHYRMHPGCLNHFFFFLDAVRDGEMKEPDKKSIIP